MSVRPGITNRGKTMRGVILLCIALLPASALADSMCRHRGRNHHQSLRRLHGRHPAAAAPRGDVNSALMQGQPQQSASRSASAPRSRPGVSPLRVSANATEGAPDADETSPDCAHPRRTAAAPGHTRHVRRVAGLRAAMPRRDRHISSRLRLRRRHRGARPGHHLQLRIVQPAQPAQ